ncbi:hypothetical protein ADEAN_000267200 [Angomonas deanei]|uniref:Uncharacterized protein n=1 Tax=Angomonas deanei TaxID=59799 RepID=A0A7G2C8Q0_9TRYP|nr:hypothetical protein ADEAN_000267200 [Angomonas deanei]
MSTQNHQNNRIHLSAPTGNNNNSSNSALLSPIPSGDVHSFLNVNHTNPLSANHMNRLTSQTHQFFKELFPIHMAKLNEKRYGVNTLPIVNNNNNNNTTNNNNNNNNNNNMIEWTNTMLAEDTTIVLHYAEHMNISCTNNEGEDGGTPQTTMTIGNLWPLRTRLLSMKQNFIYVYDAIATTVALLGGDVRAPLPLPSNDPSSGKGNRYLELNTPILVIDTAARLGDIKFFQNEKENGNNNNDVNRMLFDDSNDHVNLQVLSGSTDTELVGAHPSRLSLGSKTANNTANNNNNALSNVNLLKGSRGEDTEVYRVEDKGENEILLLALPLPNTNTNNKRV